MTTETGTGMITVPKIKIYGAGDLNSLRMFEYDGEIGSEITDFGKPYADLQDTITLGDQSTLFQAYLLSESGKLDLPKNVHGVLDYLFKETGKGNVTNDACDYDHGDKSMKKIHESDRRVLWKVAPERFEETSDGWKAIGGDEFTILVPEDGYVRWTNDGGYRPDTGTPFETGSKEEAIKSMIDHGIPENVAKRCRSYFLGRSEGNGIAAVVRYSCGVYGPFDVGASWDPSNWGSIVGRFPASRSASGASQTDRRQFNALADELDGFAARLRQATKE